MFTLGEMIENEKSEMANATKQIVIDNTFAQVQNDWLLIYNATQDALYPLAIIEKVLIHKKREWSYNITSIVISLLFIVITTAFLWDKTLIIVSYAIATVLFTFGMLIKQNKYQFVIVSSEGVKIINVAKSHKNEAIITSRKLNKFLSEKQEERRKKLDITY